MDGATLFIHDRASSRITFVELTFGLNVAFAAYEKLRSHMRRLLDKKLEEYTAQSLAAETDESKSGHQARINTLKNRIKNISTQHSSQQLILINRMRLFAVIASTICLGVLSFDLVDLLGDQVAFLISPFPIYLVLSLILYFVFVAKAWSISRQYDAFVRKFETDPSGDIKRGLDSFDGYDDDNTEDT